MYVLAHLAGGLEGGALVVVLVVVGAHEHGALDDAAAVDARANAHDGVLYHGVLNDGAVGHDAVHQVARLDARRGQEAGRGVDGVVGVVELLKVIKEVGK
eukprot:422941-Prorocentrum_minimum.AAC.2